MAYFQRGNAAVVKDLPGYINSAARQVVPEKFTRENSNLSKWPVDKPFVPDNHFQTMIVAPFRTEALSDNTGIKQRVLVLGLGGGTISGQGSDKGWTGLIVADGIAVLKQAVESKTKYNAVLLDACYSFWSTVSRVRVG